MRVTQVRQLSAILILSIVISVSPSAESAPIRSALVQPTQNQREAWLAQNAARNQRIWAKLASRSGGISAASLKTGPASLQDVWAVFSKSMRYASQLKPASTTGFLPNTPFVNDLWSRRTINAARFTQYHGMIAQMMDWNTYFSQNPTTPTIIPAVKPATNNPTNPQILVPEPSTLLISLALAGFGAWKLRRKSGSSSI